MSLRFDMLENEIIPLGRFAFSALPYSAQITVIVVLKIKSGLRKVCYWKL